MNPYALINYLDGVLEPPVFRCGRSFVTARTPAVFRSLLLLALLCFCAGAAIFAAPVPPRPNGSVKLMLGVPIWVSGAEPGPVQRAASDLSRDLKNVLGGTSPITHDRAELVGRTFIEILGPNVSNEAKHDARSDIKGIEAHGIFVKRDRDGTRMVLQGADMRGTLYAIYTFSEKFLGVKPLWFWATQPPLPQASVEIAADTDLHFGPPTVRWRAWLPNDTDLFSPWQNRTGANYDAIYETMLRLKLNCFEGSISDERSLKPPFRVRRDVEAARDRGLVFVGHHTSPLGCNYNLWNGFWRQIQHRSEPPALSVKNTEELKAFWRWHIDLARRNHVDEIWLIGFRGNGDHPFWTAFKDSPTTDKERADVITRMMKLQIEQVKAATGQAAPVMRTTLYNETSDFYAAGLLRPAAEPNLIWTYVAARRDHYPAPDAQHAYPPANQPLGYYMNFQFTSSGAHLAQAEGPWKMERNFRFIQGIAPRPLEFSVVNMGNIREFVLEGSANAAMLWDWQNYNSDRFLGEFCRMYFGTDNGPAVARLYKDFYDSYWQQRRPDLAGFERQYIFQDERLSQAMQRLTGALKRATLPAGDLFGDGGMDDQHGRYFNIVPADSGTGDKLDAIISGTGQSMEKLTTILARADALMPHLPAQDRTFFNDNLRAQARFMLAANGATHNLALAVQDRKQSVGAGIDASVAHLRTAQTAALQMRAALAEAEHGEFVHWYATDNKFGVEARIADITGLLQGKR